MANPRSPAALTPPGGPGAERDLVAAIVDTLPVLAWTAGPDGAVDYFNGQWLEFTGLPAEQALDWRWLAAIHPDDQERTATLWRAAIATGQPAEAEMRLRRADGAYLWFLSRAVALRDEAGQVRKWYGTSTEIEDRWRAEQALRDSEHNFRQIIDSVPGLIFTTAPDGAVEFVNRPLLDYFGVGLDVLRHWQQTDHVHPDDLPRVIIDATNGFASMRPFSYEERLRRHDGVYRRFRLLATPMHSPAGEVVRWYGVLTDVEEQRAAEDELSVARVRLSRAMQVAAVSELAASIAQGVMRPLEGVVEAGQACRQALASQPLDVAGALSLADGVVRDAHAAAEVVRRIRGLLRQQPVQREPLRLGDTIGLVRDLIADDLRTCGAALVIDVPTALPAVPADRLQLQQLVLGLACSALESMAALDGADRRHRALRIGCRHEDGAVVVRIAATASAGDATDAAGGPAPAAASPDGETMHLAVCRAIVQAHGGRLWVQHEPPQVLTYAFALPIDPGPPDSSR